MQSSGFKEEQIRDILEQARKGMQTAELCRLHGISETTFHLWRNKYGGKAIRVLLFVQEGRARQKYLDALAECGVQVYVTSTFHDLSEEICSHTYHGLFLDLPTKMKALKENKAYVYHLVEKFPVSHLQMDEQTGEIRCYHFNKKYGGTLLDFINNQCKDFIPQRIREDTRKRIHLHVLVCKSPEDPRPERSVTENISPGGCFVFTSRRRKEGSEVWLRFREMPDLQPIHAQIRAVVKWGENRQLPGIGLQFIDLSHTQVGELAKIVQSTRY